MDKLGNLHGVTDRNEDIFLLNCRIFDPNLVEIGGSIQISLQGYIIQTEPDDGFDRIDFYSPALTAFYPPYKAWKVNHADTGVIPVSYTHLDVYKRQGQITVPTGSGKTNEDGKVTGGYEDADGDRWTLTVKVIRTDTKRPITGSDVSIGKTGNLTVKLPDGTDMDAKHRVTIIVTDHKKNPQENKSITVKGLSLIHI